MSYDVEKPDEEWRAELNPAEYAVLRQAGTEPAFVGEYTDTKTKGVYACRRRLRRRTLHLHREVRVALRLAVLLRPEGHRRGRTDPGPLARHGPHRGAVCPVRFAPRTRLRGRGLCDAHGPAVLHQQHFAAADARRGLTPAHRPVGRTARQLRRTPEPAPRTRAGPALGMSAALVGHFAWASQTASGPAGKRSWPVVSCAARHTVSATSLSLVNWSWPVKESMVFFAQAA